MFNIGGETMFGQGRREDSQDVRRQNWTPTQQQTATKVGDFINDRVGQGAQAYGGQRVAGTSGIEQSALDRLSKFVGGGQQQDYGQATGAVNRALTGDYKDIVDPAATEKLYGAIKERALKIDLPEIQNSIASNANLSGMYFSGNHGKAQADAAGDVATKLAETLAGLRYSDEQTKRDVAREREARQLTAVQPSLTIGQTLQGDEMNRIDAGITGGALPRTLEQAKLDTDFAEYLRTLPENSPILQQAMQYLGLNGVTNTQGSGVTNTMDWSQSIKGGFGFGGQ